MNDQDGSGHLPLNPNSKSENYGEVEIRLGEV